MNRRYDNEYEQDVFKRIAQLDKPIRDYIFDHMLESIEEYYPVIFSDESDLRMDSPFEELLYLAMVEALEIEQIHYGRHNFDIIFNPKFEEKINGKTYRVDFILGCLVNGKQFSVAIECDIFQEKTKTQAAKDKSREQALIAIGNSVLRFTSSQIWDDPKQCAQEIITTIKTLAGMTEK